VWCAGAMHWDLVSGVQQSSPRDESLQSAAESAFQSMWHVSAAGSAPQGCVHSSRWIHACVELSCSPTHPQTHTTRTVKGPRVWVVLWVCIAQQWGG
jgi:hypothetical protein